MSIEAVVFDVGGVLEVNPPTGWPERWAERLDLDLRTFRRRLDALWAPGVTGHATLEQIECRTSQAFDLDHRALGALMRDAWAEYLGTLNHELAAYFIGLRPTFKTAILSNSFVGARERERAAYRFDEMCDVLVYSHEEGLQKPDPRVYHLVCNRLGVAPERAVLLDDVQQNVDGARAVGMVGVRYRGNTQAISDLDALLAR